MRKIIIYGAGGFGREIAFMIQQINKVNHQWDLVGFCDDGKAKGDLIDGVLVIGGANELMHYQESLAIVIAVADPMIRQKIRDRLQNKFLTFPTLIHPSVFVDESVHKISEGAIITAGVILTTNILIGSFAIINLNCTIGHDVVIGNFSSLMPSVNISGNVRIGSGVFIGVAATILQNLSIGDGAVIGAGSVVTDSIGANKKAWGVPAREIS